MPCYVTGSEAGDARLAAQETADRARKDRLALTRLLCLACQTLEAHKLMIPELKDWWKEHKKQDKAVNGKVFPNKRKK